MKEDELKNDTILFFIEDNDIKSGVIGGFSQDLKGEFSITLVVDGELKKLPYPYDNVCGGFQTNKLADITEKMLELACKYGCFDIDNLLRKAKKMMNNYFNGSGTIGFTCDNCGREMQGCTWVNGMKFCAKCYQETFGNKNMSDNLNNMYEAYLKILNEKDQRIVELEKELKNGIRPKFKISDKCWAIRNATNIYNEPKQVLIKEILITKNCIKYYAKNGCCTSRTNKTTMHLQSQLFATKVEAEAKLKELKGE